jgi:hypothetical protein
LVSRDRRRLFVTHWQVVSITNYAKTTLHRSAKVLPYVSPIQCSQRRLSPDLFVILMIFHSFVDPPPYEVDNNNDDISGEEAAILKDLLYPEMPVSHCLLASITNKGEQKVFLHRL